MTKEKFVSYCVKLKKLTKRESKISSILGVELSEGFIGEAIDLVGNILMEYFDPLDTDFFWQAIYEIEDLDYFKFLMENSYVGENY